MSEIGNELLGAVTRFVSLPHHPDDAAVLGPLYECEILYRLLRGPHSALLREVVTAGSYLSHIGKVTDWIRMHYAEQIRIERLASLAGISVTSFTAISKPLPR